MPFRQYSVLALMAAAVAMPSVGLAQEDYREDRGRDERIPYAGADLAYDYLTGEYYRYEGPRQQDPRAREQTGYRDGTLQTRPNNGYYAGVNWIGGQRRHHGCGCYSGYGSHRYRSSSYDYDYEPYKRENGYYERYASSNNHNWGYSDRREGLPFYNWGY